MGVDKELLQEQAKILNEDDEREEYKTPERTTSHTSVIAAQGTSSRDRVRIVRGKKQSVVKQVAEKNMIAQDFIPIKYLNTFMDEWTIKARVVSRSTLRTYDGKKSGTVFNAQLIDQSGTKIQASFFNEAALKFNDLIRQGSVYTMAGGTLRISNKNYTSIPNDYCIFFNSYSVIREIPEDQSIPEDMYEFCSIKEALKQKNGKIIDLVAIIQGADPPTEIQTKKGDKLKKVMIYVIDDGQVPTNITLFGESAPEVYDVITKLKPYSVVGFKECRVSEFRDTITLNLSRSSTIIIEPIYSRADRLHKWIAQKNKEGVEMPKAESNFTRVPLNTLSTIVKMEKDLLEGKSEGYVLRFNGILGRILTTQENMSYKACPTCSRKVVDGGTQYYCQKCDQTVQKPELLFAYTFTVKDFTNSIIARVFRAEGEKVIGLSPAQVKEMVDKEEFYEITKKIQEKNYLVKSKLSTYNMQERVDYTVLRVGFKDIQEENKMLIERVNIFLKRLKIPPNKRN